MILEEAQALLTGIALHLADQAQRTHVRPRFLDPIHAFLPGTLRTNWLPAWRNVDEVRPKRILSFVVSENQKSTILVVEWIAHFDWPLVGYSHNIA